MNNVCCDIFRGILYNIFFLLSLLLFKDIQKISYEIEMSKYEQTKLHKKIKAFEEWLKK